MEEHMSESTKRRKLAEILGAHKVTSLDKGGVRRFQSTANDLWGCCDNKGTVVYKPECVHITHFCPEGNFRVLGFPNGNKKRVDADFYDLSRITG